MKVLCLGEQHIAPEIFEKEAKSIKNAEIVTRKLDYDELVKVEKTPIDEMPVPECFDEDEVKEAEIVLCHYATFGKAEMDRMPKLKIISTARGGYENFDVEEATKRGILAIHSPGRNAEAVSDFTVGMILAEVLNLGRMYNNLSQGIWKNAGYVTTDFTPMMLGKTIGLFGFGQIGHLMAKKLSGFGTKILVYDPYVDKEAIAKLGYRKVDKETLFKEADIISVHARLTEDTYHIIGKQEFALMKEHSWFINSARSGLVDYEALLNVLKEHKIAGAALDVFDEEPLPKDSPFLELDNVTITPHYAGGARESMFYAATLATKGVISVLEGKPNHQILNPEVLEQPEFKEWLESVK